MTQPSKSSYSRAFIAIIVTVCLLMQFCNSATPVNPIYSTKTILATGRCTPIVNSLISSSNSSLSYSVAFTNTAIGGGTYRQSFVSLIGFDSYTSYEFSFNTTVVSLSLTGMQFSYRVLGNTYFTILNFHYAAVFSHFATVSNPSRMLINQCFLCTNLTAVTGDNSMEFSKVILNDTNTNSRYKVVAFIAGMKFFNQYQEIKQIQVGASISEGSNTIVHKISKTGNTTVEWACLNTVVIDTQLTVYKDYSSAYHLASTATVDYQTSMFNSGDLDLTKFDQENVRIFGISLLKLGADQGTQKLELASSNIVDISVGFQAIGVGATISNALVADVACDPASPQYHPTHHSCYDVCPDASYATVNNICESCSYTCLTCQVSATTCKDCEESLNFRTFDATPKTCPCSDGYVDVGVAICAECTDYIPECAKCSSTTSCSECNSDLEFNSTQNACVCPTSKPYYNSVTSSCWEYPGCVTGDNSSGSWVCSDCDQTKYFTLNVECVCFDNYTLDTATGQCKPTCGDGVVKAGNDMATQCDDGGTVSGDGCDSTCHIQSGFGCVNVIDQVSVCAVLRTVTLEYKYTERVAHQNQAILVFHVTNTDAQSELSQSDFAFTVASTIAHSKYSVSYSSSESVLKIRMSYEASLQDTQHTVNISYDPTKASIAAQSYSVTLSGSNYQLTYDQNPDMLSTLNLVSIVTSLLIVALFFAMIFFDQKLPATELLLSSQMVFFGVFSAGTNVGLGALKGLKYLNGYNDIQSYSINLNNYQVGSILQEDISKQYLLNYNFMAILQVLSILLMIPFKMNIWKYEKQKQALVNMTFDAELKQNFFGGAPTVSQTRKKIHEAKIFQKAYINRFYYPVNLMCMSTIVFYFGVQNYSSNINNKFEYSPVWSFILGLFALLLCQGFIVYMFQESNKSRPIFTFLRKIIYYPFHMIFLYYIIIVIYTMTISLEDYSLYILAGSSVFILVYRVLNSPYPVFFSIPSLDSLFKSVVVILALGVLIAVKTNKTESQQNLCIGVIALLLLSWVSSLVRFISVLCRRFGGSGQGSSKSEKGDNQQEFEGQSGKDNEEKDSDREETQESSDSEQQESKQEGKQQTPVSKMQQQKMDPISQIRSRQEQMVHEVLHEEEDEGELDELTLIKRRLREDLRKKRGKLHKAALRQQKSHKK